MDSVVCIVIHRSTHSAQGSSILLLRDHIPFMLILLHVCYLEYSPNASSFQVKEVVTRAS